MCVTIAAYGYGAGRLEPPQTTALTVVAGTCRCMLDKLGIAGIAGVVVMLGGIALVAWQAPIVAAGIAFVVAGLGLIVYGMIRNLMASFGMGGGMGGGMV